MGATAILNDELSIELRLTELQLDRGDLIEVTRACTAAYGGCTDNDAPAVRGFEVWRMGVRRFRELLRPKGWDKDESSGFSTIVNHRLRLRIGVTSTDDITGLVLGDLAPSNKLPKGATAERATAVNQMTDQIPLPLSLSTSSAAELPPNPDEYQTWHFCIYIKGDVVRAELSRYNGCASGFLTDCRERIFIVGDGEWEPLDLSQDTDGGPDIDFDIHRKA